MKPFPPVLKERRRYISFQAMAKVVFTENQVLHSINETIFQVLGEEGYARANFKVVEYNPKNMSGICRTTHNMLESVVAALTLMKDIQGKNASLIIRGVSGTIKKTGKKYTPAEEQEKKPAPTRKPRHRVKNRQIMRFMGKNA